MLSGLPADGGEDEGVGGDDNCQGQDRHQHDGVDGVELNRPGLVAVRHALVELLAERPALHAEDQSLPRREND